MEYTDVIRIKAGLTKRGNRMWRCTTVAGDDVYAFEADTVDRDTRLLLFNAGYGPELDKMQEDQIIEWTQSPIHVGVLQDGQWWRLVFVGKRPVGAMPDPPRGPHYENYRAMVRLKADMLMRFPQVVIWDTETTGRSTRDDEIVSIAGISSSGEVVIDQLIRPENMNKLSVAGLDGQSAMDIHGITPEILDGAPSFPEIYEQIRQILAGKLWVVYNAPYDTGLLKQLCLKHNLAPIVPLGIHCAMELFADFYGEWDGSRQQYVSQTLQTAIDAFGISIDATAHSAIGDCFRTLEVVKAIRQWPRHAEPPRIVEADIPF
jgi:DNA polymerase-3 subunit epsilon